MYNFWTSAWLRLGPRAWNCNLQLPCPTSFTSFLAVCIKRIQFRKRKWFSCIRKKINFFLQRLLVRKSHKALFKFYFEIATFKIALWLVNPISINITSQRKQLSHACIISITGPEGNSSPWRDRREHWLSLIKLALIFLFSMWLSRYLLTIL